ncbi:hypothetical protein SLEP1_g22649 [Rubroshorea leprosula]|uniref:Secreted protein n=1 Tax=Rubroshorea leprosula TaxID=152421 RepID=A0AAV5JFZ1_9ROSI|nr:hypothetical protein SLEP1_g22649 [Rubroshorea leprosula]
MGVNTTFIVLFVLFLCLNLTSIKKANRSSPTEPPTAPIITALLLLELENSEAASLI